MVYFNKDHKGVYCMKNWKHFTVLAILAVFVFVVGFIACDGNGDKTFTVTFDADNGSINTTQTITEGGKVTKPDNPTKEDYNFVYWFNIVGNLEWDFNTAVISDINLKAKWTLAESAFRNFNDQIMFSDNGLDYLADIIDERTGARNETLQQLGIVTQIKNAISEAFNNLPGGIPGNAMRNIFRNVFGQDGGITIIVNNPVDTYKLKALDQSTIYFHIDYLNSDPSDFQQNIVDVVRAMSPASPDLPFEVE